MGFARYVFDNSVFEGILNSKPRKTGEFCITDVVQTMSREGRGATCIFDGEYFVNSPFSGSVVSSISGLVSVPGLCGFTCGSFSHPLNAIEIQAR